jgi:hypothetical protein
VTTPRVIEDGDEHPIQYAIVDGLQYPASPVVYGTEALDKSGVCRRLLVWAERNPGSLTEAALYRLRHLQGYLPEIRVERFNRCPACEQWSPCDVRRADELDRATR